MAGRNANGAMVVHTQNGVVYSAGTDYCLSTMPAECLGFNPNGTEMVLSPGVVWLLWAFLPEASPGVTTVQFGIEHNIPANAGYFIARGACDGPLELPDTGWPETGFGNLCAYPGPIYQHINAFYWFAFYVDAGGNNYFGTRTYPSTNEAKFVDDSPNPVEDLCFNFGTVRWNGTGENHCPEPPAETGACCYPDGSCAVLPPDQCTGLYQGPDTVCDPNPCPAPEACCYVTGLCEFIMAEDCLANGGEPQGPGTNCTPNLCEQPPVPEACCFYDGSCQFILAADCTAQGGTPQGVGTTCETVECPLPTGACCDEVGNCTITTMADCAGTYLGDGTVCDPNPCPTPARQDATWGQIKANYR